MFLAVISHEVRSPMNAVLAAVELLEHTPLDEQQRHFTGLANSGANTLLRLVDDVLDISKMEAGQLALNLEPVDPWALVLRVVDEHRTQAQEKGIELLVTGERPGDPLLLDELRLAQVLRNLICNAVKFTDVGRVEVQLLQLEKPAVEVRQLVIRVIDTGIGLSKQAQASLFRPYAQATQSYRRTGGTGLGLVICRRLVRLMRGRLVLSSLQGVGTQVEVRLPVERAVSPQLPAPEPAPSAESANGLQVLVVDDSLPSRQVLQAQLDSLGCAVLLAADADQAVALFSAHRVDMVLIDCDSPEGHAERMVSAFRESQLQQERSYCPIIALSQFSGNEYLQRCFDAGMDGVLSKPLQQAMLQQMIELWCEVTPAPQVAEYLETPGSPEAVRQELNSLIELLALRDRGMALEALHRLRTAALDVGWEDFAATAQRIEVLLQDEVNWPAEAVAGHARSLLEHRAGLPCGA